MVRKRTTKVADATSIIGKELATLLDEEEKKRREKGELEDGMVIKSEEKGIDVTLELELRPYGGATSIADALDYLKGLAAARNVERELRATIQMWESVVENIMGDDDIKDKTAAIRKTLVELKKELKEDIEEEKSKVIKSHIGLADFHLPEYIFTLKGAMEDFTQRYPGHIPPRGALLRKVARNILDSAMIAHKSQAIDTLTEEAKADLAEKPPAFQPAEGTVSVEKAARGHRSGQEQVLLGTLGLTEMVAAIEKSAPAIRANQPNVDRLRALLRKRLGLKENKLFL